MNENGSAPVKLSGATLKPRPSSVVRPPETTARTMAARQVSVRVAAHEFHMPDAQFSVSKYQLMPQIGTDATMTAVSGSPICRPRPTADPSEYRAARTRRPKRIRDSSHQRTTCVGQARMPVRAGASITRSHARRSRRRVRRRTKSRIGTITKYASASATKMSPATATSGERIPSADRSKPMRLT